MFNASARTLELNREWSKAFTEFTSAKAHRDEPVQRYNEAHMAELDWSKQYMSSLQMDKELQKEKETRAN